MSSGLVENGLGLSFRSVPGELLSVLSVLSMYPGPSVSYQDKVMFNRERTPWSWSWD